MKPLIYGRPTWVTVDLDALAGNMQTVRRLIGDDKKCCAVVKADAYGHGSVACARQLLKAGADMLGVATVEEGAQLRQAGITAPVLLFGVSQPHEAEAVVKLELQATLVSFTQARLLNRAAEHLHKQAQVHLKVDTGMGRIGLNPPESLVLFEQLQALKHVQATGVYTHFAHADGCDKQLLDKQVALLKETAQSMKAMGHPDLVVHAANSAAVIESRHAYFDMVRPGLMLYGLCPFSPANRKVTLKPALSWTTTIIQLKDVPEGVGLSYGHTYVTTRPTKVATLPVGYADGFSRLLSNQGEVLVHGQCCPVIGRVCMDMCLVDVTLVGGVKVGDEVILIGRQGRQEVTADMMAEKRDTIAYEVVCTIGKRVPRHYLGGEMS